MAAPGEVVIELAPTGVIRAAVNIANAALAKVDERTGMLVGPSIDLADALAEETGCAVSIVRYQSAAMILAAADRNEWDVAFIAEDPLRADRFIFSPPYAFVTATYLVPVNSDGFCVADMDVSGRRIATTQGAAYTKQLERQIKNAMIIYADSPSAAIEMLRAGHCDTAAGLKTSLELAARDDARFRTLDDAFSEIPQTIAVVKENEAAASYLRSFVEHTML
ncbi:transporter substrate-binding domain-containing protein [Agrobacterium vitis]|uniref:transporter substrate-binding domain-containing protein n=1 Tax=Agrobacterium vitis TaxID=373 RepID=UPI000871C702|nr:transporter substrate-binding domain-containing protein [Agrobacterium vitis]MCE6076966.1 transporter substrate-binding domain-containing protein [Agrobacterium vitis]MCM2449713.1 transporter substrate-binding domain-containing protein [Agrobacterium vitis]MUO71713.1 transporter substrate-binding domain-containing protein [Agrobacterium vitis]MUO86209.1 transporter substrate-binding domain-containing protein [Agrobacterium vitis]